MTDVIVNVTSDTTIASTDRVVLVDSSSGQVTVTLPAPQVGLRHSIKDFGPTGAGYSNINPVFVDPGATLIDGSPGPKLLSNNEGLNLISNGAHWGTVV